MNKKTYNKGFSLVELIIVIAIMAILSAAIAPALIRYINKARKADDIAAADSIGTTLNAAIQSDDDMYDYISDCSGHNNLSPTWRDGRDYRVIAYMNVPNKNAHLPVKQMHLCPIAKYDFDGDLGEFTDKFNEYIGAELVYPKFTTSPHLDQWMLATDKDRNLYVFIGGGVSDSRCWISKDGNVYNNNGFKAYMLWPEVSRDYNKLNTPNDANP